MIYFLIFPLLLLVIGLGFISIAFTIFVMLSYLRDKTNWLSQLAPKGFVGSLVGAVVFIFTGAVLRLNWESDTRKILEILWLYFAVVITFVAHTAKERKILSGIVSTIVVLSGVYIVSFVAFFAGYFTNSPLLSFLSDPASCIKVEGGLGPDIRCEWGEPITYAILWSFGIFGLVYLFSVIKRKKKEIGNSPKILFLVCLTAAFVFLGVTLNIFYQSSPRYEEGSFRNRIDSFIPENRKAKKVGKEIKYLRLEERLEPNGQAPYKQLIIETDFYLPEEGYYRFSAWNQEKGVSRGLAQKMFIDGVSKEIQEASLLNIGDHRVKHIFTKDEKYNENSFINNVTNKSLNYHINIEYFIDPTYDTGFFQNQPPPVTYADVKTKYYSLEDWKNN